MKRSLQLLSCLFLFISSQAFAQIPHPRETFGHEVGADYKLADYGQMLEYYEKLAASTDRVQMIEIGKSSKTMLTPTFEALRICSRSDNNPSDKSIAEEAYSRSACPANTRGLG